MFNTLVVLQARLSSSRLPGKVLKPILGQPMIYRQVERLRRAKTIKNLVVATSIDPSDDHLADYLKLSSIPFVRGNLNDVLARFETAIKLFPDAEHIIRVTGDCPLIDPCILDQIVNCHILEKNDYTSNTVEVTYADGLDVEVIKRTIFEEILKTATLPYEREHVTPYIYTHSEKYKIKHFKYSGEAFDHLRWTVDHQEDYELVTKIFENLYLRNPSFGAEDILKLINENPDLALINSKYIRNEQLVKLLKNF